MYNWLSGEKGLSLLTQSIVHADENLEDLRQSYLTLPVVGTILIFVIGVFASSAFIYGKMSAQVEVNTIATQEDRERINKINDLQREVLVTLKNIEQDVHGFETKLQTNYSHFTERDERIWNVINSQQKVITKILTDHNLNAKPGSSGR